MARVLSKAEIEEVSKVVEVMYYITPLNFIAEPTADGLQWYVTDSKGVLTAKCPDGQWDAKGIAAALNAVPNLLATIDALSALLAETRTEGYGQHVPGYAQHLPSCNWPYFFGNHPCTCGFVEWAARRDRVLGAKTEEEKP